MNTNIVDDNGNKLDALIELAPEAITLHSRGGAFGKPNLRNPDYRPALRLILARLKKAQIWPAGIWLDSSIAQKWPKQDRLLLESKEFAKPVDDLVTMIGQRGAAMGRPDGSAGHGNSTKRIRIEVPGVTAESLLTSLGAVKPDTKGRLPAATLRLVLPTMIDAAIVEFQAGASHNFSETTEYSLVLPNGERLPPKAIFGIALAKVIGRPALPADFSAGWGLPCFSIIEDSGYPIIANDEELPDASADADDERVWAEGAIKRVQHLRRERSPGLAKAKKRRFAEIHGKLFCESCGLVPSESLGELGDACIEVHHDALAISKMDGSSGTRLADLKCLCANCHRIVHREQL
jgi:hypothetical protein